VSDKLEAPPVPEGLCGIGGCVFILGHANRKHSWEAIITVTEFR